jgi:hypothetical protein
MAESYIGELRGKNPPVHRREYFQDRHPGEFAFSNAREFDRGAWAILLLNHANETITQLFAELDDQHVARAIDRPGFRVVN